MQVNTSFKSRVPKASFIPDNAGPADMETRKQDNLEIQKSRKYEVQAALIRVMKAEKSCTEQQGLSKVISLLKDRFHPELRDLRREVESLIEQEYLQRDSSDRKMLTYLA